MAVCLFCATPLRHTFVDLGMSPLCERYLTAEQLNQMEPFYPLHAYVCQQCFLVQVQEYVSPEAIFTEYAYFSSYSDSWLAHARAYAEMITARLGLDTAHQVVELGSNDGYLLQYFLAKGIRALGVEPAKNVAKAAIAKGVPTAVLSRGLAGLAGRTLVVNLPGSTGGVRDALEVLAEVLPHALSQAQGGDH